VLGLSVSRRRSRWPQFDAAVRVRAASGAAGSVVSTFAPQKNVEAADAVLLRSLTLLVAAVASLDSAVAAAAVTIAAAVTLPADTLSVGSSRSTPEAPHSSPTDVGRLPPAGNQPSGAVGDEYDDLLTVVDATQSTLCADAARSTALRCLCVTVCRGWVCAAGWRLTLPQVL